MLISELIDEYIFDCEIKKFTDKTLKGYRNNLLYLEKYLKDSHNITDIKDVRTVHLKAFFKSISDNGRKESYMNGLLKTYRAFFKYAVSEGYITDNPCLKVPWAKEASPLIQTFNDSEVKRMLSVYDESSYIQIRNKAVI
ncbi:MAG: site-specific integrase [Oscillospiraceae bacterium]|nr:site-specific integrase [Oscillospiraceae bacterium]